MFKKILNLALLGGLWQTTEAQFTGVNSNFDSHYYFNNNFNRLEGGAGSNGGSISFVTDRFGADLSAIQNTKESGVVIPQNSNRAYTNQGFTFSAWINPKNFTMNPGICPGVGNFVNTFDVRMIVEAASASAPFNKDFRLFLKNGQLSIEFNTSGGLISHTFTRGGLPSLNAWQQIAVSTQTVSIPNVGLSKKITYYLNGVAQDSIINANNFNFIFSGLAMQFGGTNLKGTANCGNAFESFQGGLDDFTFLSRGLNDSEIKELYNNERVQSNVEISTLLDDHFAYYPLKFTPGNLDRVDVINRNTAIGQLVPPTYENQGIVGNRNGAAVGTLNQGGVDPRVSTRFNGHRIENGNKFIKPDSTMTIAFWVKNTGTTWNNTTFMDATNDVNANFKLSVNNAGNVVVNLGNTSYTFPSTALPLDAWCHISVSIDGKNKNLKLFVNGRLAQTFSSASKFKIPNNNDGSIFFMTTTMYFTPGLGNGWGGGGNGLVGHMNEIRFIKSALGENDILKLLSPTGKIKQKINIPNPLEYGQVLQIPNASYSNLDNTIILEDGNILRNKKSGSSSVKISMVETDIYLAYDTTVTINVSKKPVSVFIPISSYVTIPFGSPAPTFSNVNDLIFNGMLKDEDKALITGTPVWSNLDKTGVGVYDIVYQSGFESPQYTFIDAGTVNEYTITKAALTPLSFDSTVVFGDTFLLAKFAPEITGSYSYGFPQNDTDPIMEMLADGKLVALRKGTISLNFSFVPSSSNYLNYNKSVKLTVNPSSVTVNMADQNINIGNDISGYYDAFFNEGAYKVEGLKNGKSFIFNENFQFISPTVISDYNPSTSPLGTYSITLDTAQFRIDLGNNFEKYYTINKINVGKLTLFGKRYQVIDGVVNCKSCGRGDTKSKVSMGDDDECTPTFRDRNPSEVSFTVNGPFSTNLSGVNTNIPVQYEIISGPATVSNNIFTLTGEEGTVSVRLFSLGNDDYEDSEEYQSNRVCFAVSNSVIINSTENTNQNTELIIYPNPATDFVNITEFAEIFDFVGNKVTEGKDKIDVSHLTSGIYLVKTNKGFTKIIKE